MEETVYTEVSPLWNIDCTSDWTLKQRIENTKYDLEKCLKTKFLETQMNTNVENNMCSISTDFSYTLKI